MFFGGRVNVPGDVFRAHPSIGAHRQSGRYLPERVADESFGMRLIKLLRVRRPRSLWWKRAMI